MQGCGRPYFGLKHVKQGDLRCSAVRRRQGWWHYAVALDASITVMQNFYHAPSNAAGLVELVQKTAAATQGAKAVRAQCAGMQC